MLCKQRSMRSKHRNIKTKVKSEIVCYLHYDNFVFQTIKIMLCVFPINKY